MSTSEASPFPRPKGAKLPPFQDHFHESVTPSQDLPWKTPPSRKHEINTSTSYLNTRQRYCSHSTNVHPTTPSTKPRKIRAPHHRNDRQHPLTSSIYRQHCCHSTNTETDATRSPSEMCRCLSPEITSDNISPQVSHFTTVNPISSRNTCLITDI